MLKFILEVLPDYEMHLAKNPKSLITRPYGIYTVKIRPLGEVNLILLNNTLDYRDLNDL